MLFCHQRIHHGMPFFSRFAGGVEMCFKWVSASLFASGAVC